MLKKVLLVGLFTCFVSFPLSSQRIRSNTIKNSYNEVGYIKIDEESVYEHRIYGNVSIQTSYYSHSDYEKEYILTFTLKLKSVKSAYINAPVYFYVEDGTLLESKINGISYSLKTSETNPPLFISISLPEEDMKYISENKLYKIKIKLDLGNESIILTSKNSSVVSYINQSYELITNELK